MKQRLLAIALSSLLLATTAQGESGNVTTDSAALSALPPPADVGQPASQNSTAASAGEMTPAGLPPMPPMVAPESVAPASNDNINQAFSTKISVAQMGQTRGITLSGGQLQSGVVFTLPGDQVITNARLDLSLKVSPALAARNTSLQLMLNGQPLGTLPLAASDSDSVDYQLDIPAAMVVSSNNLSFKVNDAEQLVCQRDDANQYQLTILPKSSLALEGQQLNLGNDLKLFPKPFIDPLRMTPSTVPMVFSASPTPGEVSAAAIFASWLGVQTDYRGVSFPVSRNQLPEGNAVLFGHSGEQIGGVTLPQSNGPLLRLVSNPVNPAGKLLLVVGNDDDQLRQAVWRLTSQPLNTDGDSLAVTPQTKAVRQPYDAPRWINTHRPVPLHELLRQDQSLVSTGVAHDELRVNFRAAPDLFLWDGETFPLTLHYRFPTESWLDEQKSFLSVSMNGTFLRNLGVNKQGLLEDLWHRVGGDARQERYTLQLDPYLIYGDNQLQLYFNIKPNASAPCNVLANDNIRSQIEQDASIDLSNTRHFTLLPNLSYFVGASFPFSRLADYSQTLLMLPEKPSDAEIATLLGLAGRSGNATGVALNHNTVVFGVPQGGTLRERLNNSDVLAVSTLAQSGFNQSMLTGSPFGVSANGHGLSVLAPSTLDKARAWLTGDWNRQTLEADRYLSSNEQWRGFVSYRSPWNDARLVVMSLATDDRQLLSLNQDLDQKKINAGIRGDTAIITDENGIRSFHVGAQFPSGQMPWYMMVVWYASQHGVMLALLTLFITAIAGIGCWALLRRHAWKRLHPQHPDAGKKK